VALEPNGRNLIYSTYLGGSGADSGEGVAVDRAGNAFITGVTSSGDFPSMNPFQPLLAGGTDAFVTKIDPTGLRLMYSTYLGGTLPDVATAIAADERGQALITGWTDSADFPSHNPMQPFAGGGDAFVTRLNSAGAIIHSTFLGGSDFDYAYAIAAGPGAAYVTGITNSTNFPVTPGAPFSDGGIEPSPWGPQDGFAVKITDD
jgi:hypothetical protein